MAKKKFSKSDIRDFVARFQLRPGKKVSLPDDFDPADTGGLVDKSQAKALLARGIERLAEQQDMLYAQDSRALLVIFQAMDAAGKDGAIKHVMSGINPQGCQVYSFKAPSAEELDHDFLWRCMKAAPERGRIGIFNRSYYEEVLVVRVHPELLAGQRIPDANPSAKFWARRYDAINQYEKYLAENGVTVLKFFLNVSKAEQKRRFLERIETPAKHWKFSAADVRERACWDQYMKAYSECLRQTSTPWAPWHVIPADRKWFTRLAVAATLHEAMRKMKLAYPKVGEEHREALRKARVTLKAEKD